MIEFVEHHVDGDRRYDAAHGSSAIGQIGYHYGFKEWCFWTQWSIVPRAWMREIADFLDGLDEPTKEEREAYFSYEGDPLARLLK